MQNDLLNVLYAIPPGDLSYSDWIKVGMALKEEGYPMSVWDEWSKDDDRYQPGECEKKWDTFEGTDNPVKAGTIIQMATDYGWTSTSDPDSVMDWGDVIGYDADGGDCNDSSSIHETDDNDCKNSSSAHKAVEELKKYINIIFHPDEIVGFCTGDVFQDEKGQWHPKKGACCYTAQQVLESLDKYPDDLGATIGDWNTEAGAWIKFNPLDGNGAKKGNVTRFTYALVESDTIPVNEQVKLYRELRLPIAVLINSGNKSAHAIVRVDASNYEEYGKRVRYLYDYLKEKGITIDRQNSNPNRFTRLPGVTRNGKMQYIIDTNIGCKSWSEWMEYTGGPTDELPDPVSLSSYYNNRPPLPQELIKGILRVGHKMLIAGSSKSGKSFLLMQLCVAIAKGLTWLGFQCRKGKVLYINFEIDKDSCINRFFMIYEKLGIHDDRMENIDVWNLRGYAVPLDKLVPKLLDKIKDKHYDAIILDPIYKVITGDENSASAMGEFCNQIDIICNKTGASVIYCHHHSKGAQGAKRAMDRASGSGVFARDPDALLDIIRLELSEDIQNFIADDNATAWRMQSSLREFANITPVNFWFKCPIHEVDDEGILDNSPVEGSSEAGKQNNHCSKSANDAETEFNNAYDALNFDGYVDVDDMAAYIGVIDKTIYSRLKKLRSEYRLDNKKIYRIAHD